MSKRIGKVMAIVAIGTASVAVAISIAGLRFNHSASLPLGVWIEEALTFQRGQIVSVCPNVDNWQEWLSGRRCGGAFKHEPIFKPIVAAEGDTVTVSVDGISVNGEALPNSAQLLHDGYGQSITPYPSGTYTVQPETVWLVSTHHPRSFDSRYFGPVPVSHIDAAIRPLWVWSE